MATFPKASKVPYVPHSCAHCCKFVISPPGHRQPRAQDALVYRLPYSVSEARAAAKEGCSLYRGFIGLIVRHAKHSEFVSSISDHINSDTEKVYGGWVDETNLIIELAERLTKYPFCIIFHKEGQNGTRKVDLAVYDHFRTTTHLEASTCAGIEFAYNHTQWLLIPLKVTQHLPYTMFDP